MSRKEAHTSLSFAPEQVMDEWRRLYDWAVLSRQKTEYIEMISGLGQKFSGTLSAYRLAKKPQRRERLSLELITAFDAMMTFYNSLPKGDRPLLALPARDSSRREHAVPGRL
jgi:hypothetical protein